MKPVFLGGFAAFLPERAVTNEEIALLTGWRPEEILRQTGIRQRFWAKAEESASTLATEALRLSLQQAGLPAARLDYLLAGTMSPDYQVPGIAPLIQRQIPDMIGIPALDLRQSCCLLPGAIQVAMALVATGEFHCVACVGAEVLSKGVGMHSPSPLLTSLFGDGAGALLVTDSPLATLSLQLLGVHFTSDGSNAQALMVRSPGSASERWHSPNPEDYAGTIHGQTVLLHAIRLLSRVARQIVQTCGLTLEQVDWVICHQANLHLLDRLATTLQIPSSRWLRNVETCGNTGGASPFIVLGEVAQKQILRPGQVVLLLGFGAGFQAGAVIARVVEPL